MIEVVGWEVPHVHVHLVPTNDIDDHPIPPRQATTPDELAAIADKIRNA